MNNHNLDANTLSCTAVGTLLALLYSINLAEILNTMLIAATGSVVSFVVSLLCKYLWQKMKAENDS